MGRDTSRQLLQSSAFVSVIENAQIPVATPVWGSEVGTFMSYVAIGFALTALGILMSCGTWWVCRWVMALGYKQISYASESD
jgi:hypothetical protein